MVGGTKPGARDNIWAGIRTQVYCGDNSVCEADLEAPQHWSPIRVTQKQILKLTSPWISSNLAGKNYYKDPACRDIFTTISNKTWVCRLETSKTFFIKVENIKSTAIHIFLIIVLWCKLLSQAQTALTSTQEAYINVPSQLQRRWPILIPIKWTQI